MQRLQLALTLVDKFLGYKVAGVVSAESFDPRLLAETMARNRGGNVKMTTSHQEAPVWLGWRHRIRNRRSASPPRFTPGRFAAWPRRGFSLREIIHRTARTLIP
jgi:hypothetical protein